MVKSQWVWESIIIICEGQITTGSTNQKLLPTPDYVNIKLRTFIHPTDSNEKQGMPYMYEKKFITV